MQFAKDREKSGLNVGLNSSNATKRIGNESDSVEAGKSDFSNVDVPSRQSNKDNVVPWCHSSSGIKSDISLSPEYNVVAVGQNIPVKPAEQDKSIALAATSNPRNKMLDLDA